MRHTHNTHARARLTALFRDYPGEPVLERYDDDDDFIGMAANRLD